MTDTTTTRLALPTEWGDLKNFLPSEPDNTTVTKARAALGIIDSETANVRAQLNEAEQREADTAHEIVSLALDGHALSTTLAAWRPATAHAQQRLDLLAKARALALVKLQRCERSDPDVIEWRARCAEITGAWQAAMSGEPEQTFRQLVAFTERYRPSPPEV